MDTTPLLTPHMLLRPAAARGRLPDIAPPAAAHMAVYVTCDAAMLTVLDRVIRAKWLLRQEQHGVADDADPASGVSVTSVPGGEPASAGAQPPTSTAQPAAPRPSMALTGRAATPLVSCEDAGRVLGVVLVGGEASMGDLRIEAVRAVIDEISSPLCGGTSVLEVSHAAGTARRALPCARSLRGLWALRLRRCNVAGSRGPCSAGAGSEPRRRRG